MKDTRLQLLDGRHFLRLVKPPCWVNNPRGEHSWGESGLLESCQLPRQINDFSLLFQGYLTERSHCEKKTGILLRVHLQCLPESLFLNCTHGLRIFCCLSICSNAKTLSVKSIYLINMIRLCNSIRGFRIFCCFSTCSISKTLSVKSIYLINRIGFTTFCCLSTYSTLPDNCQ